MKEADTKKPIKSKVFNIMQYVAHPETGEGLFNEAMLKAGLAHKTITDWAYILHDKDIKEDGTPKPPHYHIVIRTEKSLGVDTIGAWFGIPSNYVAVPKGYNAFLNCAQYLTHELHEDKHRYEDSEITANFDFRGKLDAKMKGKPDLSAREQMRYDVLYNGKTLLACMRENELIYMKEFETLKKMRLEYIRRQEPPEKRINYYLCGNGGIGKGLMARALARSMFPQYEDDSEIFFEVGASGAMFEGYDGQPVIIWNDFRAGELLKALGGRGNVFNIFDTHPTRQMQNVKYSAVNLCNCVNIVNGVDGYKEFLDGLAGEYVDRSGEEHKAEDKGQSYRRFPFIIPIHENDFDLLINKGFMDGTREFGEYIEYRHIRGNIQKIRQLCARNEALVKEMEAKTVKPIIDKHNEVMALDTEQKFTEDEIRAMLADYGTIAPPVPPSVPAPLPVPEPPPEAEPAEKIEDDLPF